jgi:hypothetical protein
MRLVPTPPHARRRAGFLLLILSVPLTAPLDVFLFIGPGVALIGALLYLFPGVNAESS